MTPTSYSAPQHETALAPQCLNLQENVDSTYFYQPKLGILFDGRIPTSIADNSTGWLELMYKPFGRVDDLGHTFHFDFSAQPDYIGVGSVEFVMFNCDLSSGGFIFVFDDSYSHFNVLREYSCNRLVKSCMSFQIPRQRRFSLDFRTSCLILAEIVFYKGNCGCGGEIPFLLDSSSTITERGMP